MSRSANINNKESSNKVDLTEAQKEIFLKFLKYDAQLAVGNIHKSLCTLMVDELNRTNVLHTKNAWFRLLKSWQNYIKSNDSISFADSPSDQILKQLLNDEFASITPTNHELSCILNHLAEQNSNIAWERISNELSSEFGKKGELYWRNVFAAVKARTIVKAQLLESLQSNNINISDDLQMTDIENRILQQGNSNVKNEIVNGTEDRCRVCLQYGYGFVNLFQESNQTPSLIDKLMECTRISQLAVNDGFPQSICELCLSQLDIAYSFRILSEESEQKLKNQLTIENVNVMDIDSIDGCDDGGQFGDDFHVDDLTENKATFEIWSGANQTSEILKREIVVHQCETCAATFETAKLLKKHMQSHDVEPEAEQECECKTCGSSFENSKLLKKHMRTHVSAPVDEPDCECKTCGSVFENPKLLKKHMRSHVAPPAPTEDGEYECEYCGSAYGTIKLLRKHITTHIFSPHSLVECQICLKSYKTEALLKSHSRIHLDLRRFICEVKFFHWCVAVTSPISFQACGKRYRTKSQLASHCLTHTKVKNFQCSNCSYKANSLNNLRVHLRTHTRVQPYVCRFCQFKFSTSSNMQKHIRNIHQQLKTQQCTECDKTFFAKESLRKHMVTHTGDRVYSCNICSANYAWYNGLRKHFASQHAGEKCPSE
ncbi:Zinc finger protein, partial [Pseudolycoriella hygida]